MLQQYSLLDDSRAATARRVSGRSWLRYPSPMWSTGSAPRLCCEATASPPGGHSSPPRRSLRDRTGLCRSAPATYRTRSLPLLRGWQCSASCSQTRAALHTATSPCRRSPTEGLAHPTGFKRFHSVNQPRHFLPLRASRRPHEVASPAISQRSREHELDDVVVAAHGCFKRSLEHLGSRDAVPFLVRLVHDILDDSSLPRPHGSLEHPKHRGEIMEELFFAAVGIGPAALFLVLSRVLHQVNELDILLEAKRKDATLMARRQQNRLKQPRDDLVDELHPDGSHSLQSVQPVAVSVLSCELVDCPLHAVTTMLSRGRRPQHKRSRRFLMSHLVMSRELWMELVDALDHRQVVPPHRSLQGARERVVRHDGVRRVARDTVRNVGEERARPVAAA